MNRINEIAGHSEVSEKSIEQYLIQRTKERNGLCLKYDNPHEVGYPDRIVILPFYPAFWVEVKSYGKKPREIQAVRHRKLESLGQKVFVVDCKEQVDEIFNKFPI